MSVPLSQVSTGLQTATVSWPVERTVTPTCGPSRRAHGSPPWSSSGSTALLAVWGGRHGRTSSLSAAAHASSPSATSSRKTTGEVFGGNLPAFNLYRRTFNIRFFFNFLIKYDFLPTGGCVNTSRSQSAPPSSVWTGIPTTSCWLLDPVTSNAGTQMCYFICESILMTTLNTYNLLGLLSTLCMWHQFIFVCVTTVKEGKCCYFWSNQ